MLTSASLVQAVPLVAEGMSGADPSEASGIDSAFMQMLDALAPAGEADGASSGSAARGALSLGGPSWGDATGVAAQGFLSARPRSAPQAGSVPQEGAAQGGADDGVSAAVTAEAQGTAGNLPALKDPALPEVEQNLSFPAVENAGSDPSAGQSAATTQSQVSAGLAESVRPASSEAVPRGERTDAGRTRESSSAQSGRRTARKESDAAEPDGQDTSVATSLNAAAVWPVAQAPAAPLPVVASTATGTASSGDAEESSLASVGPRPAAGLSSGGGGENDKNVGTEPSGPGSTAAVPDRADAVMTDPAQGPAAAADDPGEAASAQARVPTNSGSETKDSPPASTGTTSPADLSTLAPQNNGLVAASAVRGEAATGRAEAASGGTASSNRVQAPTAATRGGGTTNRQETRSHTASRQPDATATTAPVATPEADTAAPVQDTAAPRTEGVGGKANSPRGEGAGTESRRQDQAEKGESAPLQRTAGQQATPSSTSQPVATSPVATSSVATSAETTRSGTSRPATSGTERAATGTWTNPGSAAEAAKPASQVATAFVTLGASRGTRQVSIRLDPEELGRVEIRIEQGGTSAARVTLTADRSQTLDLLMRDQAQLHHALDQAGIPAEGRAVTFHLAAPANTPSPAATDATGTGGSFAGTGTSSGDSQGSGGRQGGARPDGTPQNTSHSAGGDATGSETARWLHTNSQTRWLRAGVDITA